MRVGTPLSVLSHLINFAIVINFTVYLLKLNALDTPALMISAFGIFVSLIANIVSVIEERL